jgi:hydroxymethylpyrimidine pyrophosphatase-like HAD family hydrolase
MRFHVLACDYDGTLAHHGLVDAATVAALERLLTSGRQLILVTGRELGELRSIFPQVTMFARIVAENGALLYEPGTEKETVLCAPPSAEFVAALRQHGVAPMSVGRVIVATWRPHETAVLRTISDMGLEMQVIFNKDAVMALPSGVNKATGLSAALAELGFAPEETVGVGDAENDHSFMHMCGCSAAVANALPSVKETADIVLQADHGAGVAQLIDSLVTTDLASIPQRKKNPSHAS